MSELTKLYLPPSFPFPVIITAVLIRPGFEIEKHTPVLKYKYWENQVVPTERLEPEEVEKYEHSPKIIKVENIGSFESPILGKVIDVKLKVGDKFENDKQSIGTIEEPCTHAVQFGGLCGICGANLADEVDYSNYNNKNRAPITMAHQSTQLTVSLREAERIEKGSRKKLLEEEKLILVVDLDQTVIQTINDPTVYQWQQDPNNPNYEALKDVKAFALEEKFKPFNGNNKEKPLSNKSWYYVKLRPGLEQFLKKLAPKYEMHIYTMATRDYAKQIAKIIDPTGEYFGDRILSRDESGSITQKSLHRLFPTNTSMVVIIDDRGDVWQWCPNLVKVVPYDFFIGIGDINSGFLPKQSNLLRPSKKRKIIDDIENQFTKNNGVAAANEEASQLKQNSTPEVISDKISKTLPEKRTVADDSDTSSSSSDDDDDDDDDDDVDDIPSKSRFATESHVKNNSTETQSPITVSDESTNTNSSFQSDALGNQRFEYLKKLENSRPLAKLQETLDKTIEERESKTSSSKEQINGPTTKEQKKGISERSLLYDDDNELEDLGKALLRVNERFYEEYRSDKLHPPDVKILMPEMKSEVLGDTRIMFSGVVPINTYTNSDPDIVIWARNFGATIESKVSSKLTHIISFEAKTLKIRFAKTIFDDDKIKILHPDWLFACFSKWEKVPTDEYEIKFDPKDKLTPKFVETLKASVYEPDEEENYELIDNIDLSGADKELEDFLGSSGDDDDDDDDDGDDDNDEERGNDTTLTSSNGNSNSHHHLPSSNHKRLRLSIDLESAMDIDEVTNNDNDDKEDDEDFAAELELELESDGND